jgi:hypothetical protein
MERICPHGVGHPDPDDAAYHIRIGQGYKTIHGCDGCCRQTNLDAVPAAGISSDRGTQREESAKPESVEPQPNGAGKHKVHDYYVVFNAEGIPLTVASHYYASSLGKRVVRIPHWIPVDERLPERNEMVQVILRGRVSVGTYSPMLEDWWAIYHCGLGFEPCAADDVTSWMPLSELPQ